MKRRGKEIEGGNEQVDKAGWGQLTVIMRGCNRQMELFNASLMPFGISSQGRVTALQFLFGFRNVNYNLGETCHGFHDLVRRSGEWKVVTSKAGSYRSAPRVRWRKIYHRLKCSKNGAMRLAKALPDGRSS